MILHSLDDIAGRQWLSSLNDKQLAVDRFTLKKNIFRMH